MGEGSRALPKPKRVVKCGYVALVMKPTAERERRLLELPDVDAMGAEEGIQTGG